MWQLSLAKLYLSSTWTSYIIYPNKQDNYKNNHVISYKINLTNSLSNLDKQSKQIHHK
jgi:hypothetical protein